jgi:hypothetical protein
MTAYSLNIIEFRTVFVRNPLGRNKLRWENSIKIELKEIVWKIAD